VGDRWMEGVLKVREKVMRFFSNKSIESLQDRPTLDRVEFSQVWNANNLLLVAPFFEW